MKFENPLLLQLLWSLLLLPLLLLVYWNWRKRKLKDLGSPALAQRLLLGFSERRFWFKNLLFAAALALVVVALANPLKPVKHTPTAQQRADVLIALDVSQSMLANDVKPSRLSQAKKTILELVKALEGERIGLIFFAGDAFAQMPLSTDYESLMLFVNNASPDFINDRGTDLAPPIELAGRMFGQEKKAGHALILLSDGEQHEEIPNEKARQANKDGMVIHTVSIGTAAGSTIPMESGGLKKDYSGKTVRSSSNESLMHDLAQAGGGNSYKISDKNTVPELAAEIDKLEKATYEAQTITEQRTLFQWFLIPALLLLVFEQLLWWRKGK